MKLNPDKVMKKLEEWNELTQFALILQNEAYKAGLNNLSPENKLRKLDFSEKEIVKILLKSTAGN